MKKFYSTLIAFSATILFASAQCTIDPSAQTTPGANPSKENLPCIERTVSYNQTVQGKIQETGDTTITVAGFTVVANIRVDSVRIDSITGLPTNINWAKSPDILLGGDNGCMNFSGTTTDTAGTYDLTAWGTVWFRITANPPVVGPIDTPYTYQGSLNRFSPFGDYYVVVTEKGAPCVKPTGIRDFSAELNAAIAVYPNPNNGNFVFTLNTGNRVTGNLNVVDMNGKVVYTKPLDVAGFYSNQIDLSGLAKGLYAVQLRTTEGVASKNILID
jgi:hypothetical protein